MVDTFTADNGVVVAALTGADNLAVVHPKNWNPPIASCDMTGLATIGCIDMRLGFAACYNIIVAGDT